MPTIPQSHKIYPKNEDGRDFIVGDIHGCYLEFLDKLVEINFNGDVDRMFSVGDLVDRGQHSKDCAELLTEKWFYAVRGNHEEMMIRATFDKDPEAMRLWYMNGGTWSLDEDPMDIYNLASLMNDLPYFITIERDSGDIGICHAEPPTFDWHDTRASTRPIRERAIWGRSIIEFREEQQTKNVHKTYHGHTPLLNEDPIAPVTLGNAVFLDTGAVYSRGHLTILEIK